MFTRSSAIVGVGGQYRSGIDYYNDGKARLARESMEARQKVEEARRIVPRGSTGRRSTTSSTWRWGAEEGKV